MNTTGNKNTQAGKKVSVAQSKVVGLIKHFLPPHADNEMPATYFQSNFAPNQKIVEWPAVHPDSLIDEEKATKYDVHVSPTRSAIFDSGKTSRINVAHFMSHLIIDDANWQHQIPVIYINLT
jgi:hypothetical protein